jgi:hypothetical protein
VPSIYRNALSFCSLTVDNYVCICMRNEGISFVLYYDLDFPDSSDDNRFLLKLPNSVSCGYPRMHIYCETSRKSWNCVLCLCRNHDRVERGVVTLKLWLKGLGRKEGVFLGHLMQYRMT